METLTPRKLANKIKKQLEIIEEHKNQKPVKEMTITVEWRKSRTWGNCPSAEAVIEYHDGTFKRTDKRYYAGGCGYDKESTVIAEIFNDYLRYKLYQKHKWKDRINQEKVNHPYGVYYYDGSTEKRKEDSEGYIRKPSFNGGVGTSCYYKISEFIGGKFENIANGKTFGVFKYTDNIEKPQQ
jgi:hypothetical protein